MGNGILPPQPFGTCCVSASTPKGQQANSGGLQQLSQQIVGGLCFWRQSQASNSGDSTYGSTVANAGNAQDEVSQVQIQQQKASTDGEGNEPEQVSVQSHDFGACVHPLPPGDLRACQIIGLNAAGAGVNLKFYCSEKKRKI